MAVATTEVAEQQPYPVRLWMEYPERLSRLATFFRLFLAIPVLLFLALIGVGSLDFATFNGADARNTGAAAGSVGGSIVLAIWVTILLRRNIPRWLFDFLVATHRFTYRAYAYIALLTDKYPAFEGNWFLQYWVDYPARPSRWKVFFWKLITSIPHFFVLTALSGAAAIVIVIAWFAILFTGAFPRGMHEFVVGVMRWGARVTAYFESLTDAFPPFSLDHDAGAGSRSAETICAIIGGIVLAVGIAVLAAVFTFFLIFLAQSESEDVSYADVIGGRGGSSVEIDDVTFTLAEGEDPTSPGLLAARAGHRLVQFTIEYEASPNTFFGDTEDIGTRRIDRDSVRLETDADSSIDPVLLTFDAVVPPLRVDDDAAGTLVAIFEIEDEDRPEELRAYPNEDRDRHVAWQFR